MPRMRTRVNGAQHRPDCQHELRLHGVLRSSLVPGLLALSARLLNPTSYLSSASVSYPIPPDSRVGAPFAQAGFSGRGNARRSPSHRASTRGPLERPGTRPSGRLLRRSPRRAPRRGRGDRPPEPPSPLTRRGASNLLSVFALLPRLFPPLPTDGAAVRP